RRCLGHARKPPILQRAQGDTSPAIRANRNLHGVLSGGDSLAHACTSERLTTTPYADIVIGPGRVIVPVEPAERRTPWTGKPRCDTVKRDHEKGTNGDGKGHEIISKQPSKRVGKARIDLLQQPTTASRPCCLVLARGRWNLCSHPAFRETSRQGW